MLSALHSGMYSSILLGCAILKNAMCDSMLNNAIFDMPYDISFSSCVNLKLINHFTRCKHWSRSVSRFSFILLLMLIKCKIFYENLYLFG